jgi:hypothetical protein
VAAHPHHGSDVPGWERGSGANRTDLLESRVVAEVEFDGGTAVRAEWRAEEEQWSRAALERWEHGRGLADVARDSMHRGDTVMVVFPLVTWSGAAVAVGDDVLRVDADGTHVDIRLAVAAPFVLRTRPEDRDTSVGDSLLTTFTARLRELDGTPVCIGTAAGLIEGTLRVGRDQLRLVDRDAGCAYVPTGSVWWVRPLDDD